MTKQEYKLRCGQLRAVIAGRQSSAGPFRATYIRGTRYIYNTLARNVIMKHRSGLRRIGVQYRATSIYSPVLSRKSPNPHYTPLFVASPNLVRHVRDVRTSLGLT